MTFNPECWTEANDTAFQLLCQATGSAPDQQGFRGYLPPYVDVWAFVSGGSSMVESLWAKTVTSICMNGEIEGRFTTLEAAETFAMMVASLGQIRDVGNITLLRIARGGSPSTPEHVAFRIAGTEEDAMVWRMKIGLELVFSTQSEDGQPDA